MGDLCFKESQWTIGNTYAEIYQGYIHYLQNNYGNVENITVVCDGCYLNYFTKDTTHLRRSNSKQGESIAPALDNSYEQTQKIWSWN